mmetsp:Transcript_12701/g.21137  ORF Transcript_12701/g.21137 Transcript_12701/m.21137 type:complete len:421 (+) Transcript_12701:82-1344(+)|eukprot:CAMPEP_0119009044 /NCGR_PEP_ID=MMETSP1176-20130426/4108_1 /TAXON_ID=265551 /ORGANISM="Synedropsis recta cf, Strain CCMP1620" /LENGTH=420 /DNA_ID=CAMNT_0006961487 /DNA_START=77 /DNA_END=1339 /DNA_ORIENTATION=-
MQATAKTTLASLVEDHLTSLVRETICVQRHAKRARFHQTSEDDGIIRRRLHAEDINLALQWRGSERLYATGTVLPTTHDSKKKVDLNAYLKSEMQDRPPSEIGLTMHWLAVDGTQPLIPQNPSHGEAEALVHRVEDEEDQLSQYQANQQGVRVRQLLPRLLSEELQLYFTRITLALEKGGATPSDRQQQDDALSRVARDAGLQELVPFFIQYLAKQLHLHVGHPEHCRTLIRLTRSLLINPHVHLELHLHQLLPAVMTNVVAKNLSTKQFENHWALRNEAAQTLRQACDLFGEKYPSLKATVLKKLCEAIGEDRPLTTVYGGLVGVALFGPKAVDAFMLPVAIHYWTSWAATLDKADDLLIRCEIQQCQQAMLNAVGVFLQGASHGEQANRISMEELEDAFGDQLVPLRNEPNEYAMSFI